MTIDPYRTIYVFDIDGTLTEPRQKMTEDFCFLFSDWSQTREVVLATGSDYQKVKQQLPSSILDRCQLVFCCMGNEVRNSDGTVIDTNSFTLSEEMENDLKDFLVNSSYAEKVGRHIEYRTGMVNFSVVGRNASLEQRKRYNLWDKVNQERVSIAEAINSKYPEIDATVGGSISIDIIKKGADKGQVVKYLQDLKVERLVFVGDRCYPGGNDFGIVRELEVSSLVYEWFNVESPKGTIDLILNNSAFKRF